MEIGTLFSFKWMSPPFKEALYVFLWVVRFFDYNNFLCPSAHGNIPPPKKNGATDPDIDRSPFSTDGSWVIFAWKNSVSFLCNHHTLFFPKSHQSNSEAMSPWVPPEDLATLLSGMDSDTLIHFFPLSLCFCHFP